MEAEQLPPRNEIDCGFLEFRIKRNPNFLFASFFHHKSLIPDFFFAGIEGTFNELGRFAACENVRNTDGLTFIFGADWVVIISLLSSLLIWNTCKVTSMISHVVPQCQHSSLSEYPPLIIEKKKMYIITTNLHSRVRIYNWMLIVRAYKRLATNWMSYLWLIAHQEFP